MSFNTIPTDSLFRSNTSFTAPASANTAQFVLFPTRRDQTPGSFFNQCITPPTTTPATAAVTPLTAPTPAVPVMEQQSGSFASIPPKMDLSSIPPAFFVGPRRENLIVFESQSSNSDSFGYGDRRLSTVLAQDREEENKEEKVPEVPLKRVLMTAADASRGIFGDRKLKAVGSAIIEITYPTNVNNPLTTEDMLEPTKTIRVFGYPAHLTHDVVQFFMTYGKIEEYKETPGKWMTVRYESSACALAALAGNGVFISKDYMIGVVMEPQEISTDTISPPEVKKLKPIENSDSLFKDLHRNKSSLGNGKVGISATDTNNANVCSGGIKNFANVGFMTKLKDYLLSW